MSALPPDTQAFLERSRAKTRRFRLILRALLIVLVALWIVSAYASTRDDLGPLVRSLLAFAPMLPLLAIIAFLRKASHHLDEHGRTIVVRGAAWGMGVSLPLVFLCGLAHNARLDPPMGYLPIVLLILWVSCGVGLARAARRLQ